MSPGRYVSVAEAGLWGRSQPPDQKFHSQFVGSSSTMGLNLANPRQIEH